MSPQKNTTIASVIKRPIRALRNVFASVSVSKRLAAPAIEGRVTAAIAVSAINRARIALLNLVISSLIVAPGAQNTIDLL